MSQRRRRVAFKDQGDPGSEGLQGGERFSHQEPPRESHFPGPFRRARVWQWERRWQTRRSRATSTS
eukprot:9426376-Lingulodinium_polyedra.AAC.1